MAEPGASSTAIIGSLTSVGGVIVLAIGIINYLKKSGSREGSDDAQIESIVKRQKELGEDVQALQRAVGTTNNAVAVLQDIARRAEASERGTNEKLDRLLEGQAALRAQVNSK